MEAPQERVGEGSMRTFLFSSLVLILSLFFPNLSNAEVETWNISVVIHQVDYTGTATVNWNRGTAHLTMTGTTTPATITSEVSVANARGPYWIATVLYAQCSFALKLEGDVGVAGPEEQSLFALDYPCSSIGGYGTFTMTKRY